VTLGDLVRGEGPGRPLRQLPAGEAPLFDPVILCLPKRMPVPEVDMHLVYSSSVLGTVRPI
jgi:hypothetical protein